jgi:NADP-dependent 3-hydroxy acid dehydrogenase YdfG
MHIDLEGKVAIVTGAGRGIGRAIATTLGAEKVTTVITDVRQDYLDSVAEEFAARGWRGGQHRCDVRDAGRIGDVVAATVEAFGRVDILVNNAGVAGGAPVAELSEETWDLNQDVNLKGTFLMCRAVIPVMKRQRWGRIINASSFAAIIPIAGGAAYAASKAGVHYFTRVRRGRIEARCDPCPGRTLGRTSGSSPGSSRRWKPWASTTSSWPTTSWPIRCFIPIRHAQGGSGPAAERRCQAGARPVTNRAGRRTSTGGAAYLGLGPDYS